MTKDIRSVLSPAYGKCSYSVAIRYLRELFGHQEHYECRHDDTWTLIRHTFLTHTRSKRSMMVRKLSGWDRR